METTAAVLRGSESPFGLASLTLADPGPGEVLVRLVATGMCHTDLSMREVHRDTPWPVVLGHEGAGVIEGLGSAVSGLSLGQPVVLSYNSCGGCRPCQAGTPNYCDQMWPLNFHCSRLDGSTALSVDGHPVGSHYFGQSSFAAHAVVSARSVVPVGADVDLTIAGPLGCGVQTGAGAVFNTFDPDPGDALVVFGCGAVGLSAVLAAVEVGCSPIIGVDIHRSRLDLALDVGATHAVEAGPDVVSEVLAITHGRGVDYSFDAVGAVGVLEAAVEVLAPRGLCGLVAAGGPNTKVSLSPRHLILGRRVAGIIEGDAVPQVFIPRLLELHRQGRFPFDRLITHFPFAEINEAEAASHRGDVIKPVLVMP
ncbi:MAG: NAD(P)-dependent alcohol dehydrogenase [Actinomycetia bacterium]|nr:NAD(P)-dependent alcohol dehydrogenase [Actinomycetes bacterium]